MSRLNCLLSHILLLLIQSWHFIALILSLAIFTACNNFYAAVFVFFAIIIALLNYAKSNLLAKRLSPFFTAPKIVFLHCSIIQQQPDKKKLKKLSCKEIFDAIEADDKTVAVHLLNDWTYIAITHEAVICKLLACGRVKDNKLICKCFAHSEALTNQQNKLTHENCKCCNTVNQKCRYKRAAKIKRNFFFIIFKTGKPPKKSKD